MSSSDFKTSPKVSRRQFLRDSLLMGGAAMVAPRFMSQFGVPYTINPRLVAQTTPITLQFWHQWGGPPNSTALQAVCDGFHALYPNITVVPTNITDTSQITAAFASGNPPDIQHFVLSTAVPQYAHSGALVDLTPRLDKDIPGWDKLLYPYGREVASYNGKVYSVAGANFNVGLLWNTDLFTAAGLDPTKGPQTLEDLVTWADKLTIIDKSGNIQQMGFIPDYPGAGAAGQYVNLILYGWAFGGSWYDATANKITANDPKNIEALKWELAFYTKYGAQKLQNFVKSAGNYLTAQDIFESGKLAMVYDGEWNLAFGDAAFVPKMNTGGFPAPASNPSMFGVSYADSDPNCLPTGSTHQDEAWEFLKYYGFTPAVSSAFAQVVANPSPLLDHPQFPLEKDPRFEWFVNQQLLPSQKIFPRIPVSQSYFDQLNQAEQSVLYGQATPEDALNQVTTAVQALLDSAGPAA